MQITVSSRLMRAAVSSTLLCVLGVLACSDSTGTAPDPVASVTISGAPSAPQPVNSNVQLSATVRAENGSILPNATVTWTSSNTAIASVAPSGLVTGVSPGTVTITAAAGGRQDEVSLEFAVTEQGVGPGGGVITFLNGAVTLEIPPGALRDGDVISVRQITPQPSHARQVSGTGFHVGRDGIVFNVAVKMSVRFDPANVPPSLPHAGLQLYRLEGTTWKPRLNSYAHQDAPVVTGEIWESGTYLLIATPPDRIDFEGELLGGGIYTGQATQLDAIVRTVQQDTLPSWGIEWSSSNSSAVTVDQTGRLTAVSSGVANITATMEGKTASTTIAALARPVASWQQTADWSTHQGNVRHTGHINATLDPIIFRTIWEKNLGTNPLHQAVAGGGRVYVTQEFYFANETRVYALEPTTGAEQWRYNVGISRRLGPPTYADGRVFALTGSLENAFVWALDASSGALHFKTAYLDQNSAYLSPVVADDVVYTGGGYFGGMLAFSALDGTEKWSVPGFPPGGWTPALSGDRLYAHTGPDTSRLSVRDAASGEEIYRIPDPGYLQTGWGRWNAPVLGNRDNIVLTQKGRLVSFDLNSQVVGWSLTDAFIGDVAIANDRIYVINDRRIEARNEADGSLIWAWDLPWGNAMWNLVVTDNLVFVSGSPYFDGSSARTYAIDTGAGRHVWTYPAGGTLSLGADGILFIAQPNGTLTAVSVR